MYKFVNKQLDWGARVKHRSIWTDHSRTKHSAYMVIKTHFVTLGTGTAR